MSSVCSFHSDILSYTVGGFEPVSSRSHSGFMKPPGPVHEQLRAVSVRSSSLQLTHSAARGPVSDRSRRDQGQISLLLMRLSAIKSLAPSPSLALRHETQAAADF